MPELPEVETIVRGLRDALPGSTITRVSLGKTDFIDDPVLLDESLPGSCIVAVERFGKFIRLDLVLPGGAVNLGGRRHLLVHLGMTGRLIVCPAGAPIAPHTHAFFQLDDSRELRYIDARRFGRIFLIPQADIGAFRSRFGKDPLEISDHEFRQLFLGRRARIKALLLDQSVLHGCGNIYADESLWLARIHPARMTARLSGAELARLRRAIRRVLCSAIRFRGSSIADYVDARGTPGEYQRRHRVYRRYGKPCFRCGASIRRTIVAGRGTHFCPRCQPPPRPKSYPARKS